MNLKELAEAISAQKHSNVPAHARPKIVLSDKDANNFTRAVVAFMRYKGHYARRLSSEGRYRPGQEVTDVIGHRKQLKGQWLPGVNVGMTDVFALICPSGRFVGIEIKIGKDRQSDDQKEFQDGITKAGGVYIITRNWTDFIQQINPLVK